MVNKNRCLSPVSGCIPIFDPWVPLKKSVFDLFFLEKKLNFWKLYDSQKPVFWWLGAICSPRGHENRVRDGLLHLLAMGNLWGMMVNLCSDLFSDLAVCRFCSSIFPDLKNKIRRTPGLSCLTKRHPPFTNAVSTHLKHGAESSVHLDAFNAALYVITLALKALYVKPS